MPRYAFITVTDYAFFPGTLATINSVGHFHPDVEIYVVANHKRPLTPPQIACFQQSGRVRVFDSRRFDAPGRYINAWELKAYACHDLCADYDVIACIDSDCLLCSKVDDVIERCHARGGFAGGRDGVGVDYDASYAVYGIPAPARNPHYMSTSLLFAAVNDKNRRVLERWADCVGAAEFNGSGPHPGHGDQGLLNAVLYAEHRLDDLELLDNRLWSQHWSYWDTIIDFCDGRFVNLSAGGLPQRTFHCGGTEKFWSREHRERVLDRHSLETFPYVWFLAMLWFGRCSDWGADPFAWLPADSRHLLEDLVHFFPQIVQVHPPARGRWDALSDAMLDRLIDGVPRALSLGGGSMSELIELVSSHRGIRRYVEVGGYEGGSMLSLALRFLNRDLDFYAVESFAGNKDGTMDGWPLPSRRKYMANLARYPELRVTLLPADSAQAATFFDDGSLDCVFIDACHETPSVLRDIDVWKPKLVAGGLLAGDDYGWPSVRTAVEQRFARVNATPSGCLWWLRC